MVDPEPCNQLSRWISAAISGKGIAPNLGCPQIRSAITFGLHTEQPRNTERLKGRGTERIAGRQVTFTSPGFHRGVCSVSRGDSRPPTQLQRRSCRSSGRLGAGVGSCFSKGRGHQAPKPFLGGSPFLDCCSREKGEGLIPIVRQMLDGVNPPPDHYTQIPKA